MTRGSRLMTTAIDVTAPLRMRVTCRPPRVQANGRAVPSATTMIVRRSVRQRGPLYFNRILDSTARLAPDEDLYAW